MSQQMDPTENHFTKRRLSPVRNTRDGPVSSRSTSPPSVKAAIPSPSAAVRTASRLTTPVGTVSTRKVARPKSQRGFRATDKASFKVYDQAENEEEDMKRNVVAVDPQFTPESKNTRATTSPAFVTQVIANRAQERAMVRPQAGSPPDNRFAPASLNPRGQLKLDIQSSCGAFFPRSERHDTGVEGIPQDLGVLKPILERLTELNTESQRSKVELERVKGEVSSLKSTIDEFKANFSLSQRRIALLEKQNRELKQEIGTLQPVSLPTPTKTPPPKASHTPTRASPLSQTSTSAESISSIPSLIITPMTPPMSADKKSDRETAFGVFSALAMRRREKSSHAVEKLPIKSHQHKRGLSLPPLRMGLSPKDVNVMAAMENVARRSVNGESLLFDRFNDHQEKI